MYRHLLAFFALLSGFLAYGEPVEARALSEAAAQLQQNEASAKDGQAASLASEGFATGAALDGNNGIAPRRSVASLSVVQTVRIGTDRAYE